MAMNDDLSDGAAARDRRPDISLVVPCFNEALALDNFFSRTREVLGGLGVTWEIICVNDGSRDETLPRLIAETRRDARVVVVDLTRNFGKEAALTAGLDRARGRAVIPIDADLQDPPELIGEMLAKWREGYDVVYATRAARREDTRAKRLSADWFYRFYNRMTTVPIPAHAGDFRLMDARVVAALRQLPERNRFMKGLFGWLGFRQTAVAYERPPRTEGTTSFNYWRLWNFALDGLTSFSTVPLRIWSYLGFVVALIAFFYATILIGRTLIFGIDVPGYTSLMVTILFLGGVQLLSLGIMGEYLGRTYNEVKQRPVYLVDRIYAASRGGMEAAETAESDREPAA